MTFSIIAVADGLLGGAVASHAAAAGSRVLWARPGVGLVATQASTRIDYGVELLDELAGGEPVAEALWSRLGPDAHADTRQVAVIDASGGLAQHTGESCVGVATQAVGAAVCAQGNMLHSAAVPDAMVMAFEQATSSFADRLLAGLRAGEDAGGDFRGTRAARLLVVDATTTVLDLRVEDHPRPIEELARVRAEAELQRSIATSQQALFGMTPLEDGLSEALTAMSSTSPEREAERWLWLALLHAAAGRREPAVAAIRRAATLRESVGFALDRLAELDRVDRAIVKTVREGLVSR